MITRLPFEPLEQVFRRHYPLGDSHDGWNDIPSLEDRIGPRLARCYYRARANGWITPEMADELCLLVNHVPQEFWSEW